MLRKLGMSKTRMTSKYALFWQLLFPIASPGQNDIDDDPARLSTNYWRGLQTRKYAVINRDQGGSRGHAWTTTYAQEKVRWDGIIMRNKNKTVTDTWDENTDGLYEVV